MSVAAVESKAGNIGRAPGWMPGSLQEDELDLPGKFRRFLPKMHLRQLVAAYDPEQLIIRIQDAEPAHRVDGVALPSPLQFHLGYLESPVSIDGRPKHRQAVCSARLHFLLLERSLRRRHEDQPVKLALLVGVLRRQQVSDMYRVKTAA